MTRRTITITAPNGAKVRTVHSKRLFVVRFGELQTKWDQAKQQQIQLAQPEPFAAVVKRTDSYVTADTTLRGTSRTAVYATWVDPEDDKVKGRFLTSNEVADRARSEKSRKAFAARVGNNGPARSLHY